MKQAPRTARIDQVVPKPCLRAELAPVSGRAETCAGQALSDVRYE
jgi:hypothetical protein